MKREMSAKFDGRCRQCGSIVLKGSRIVYFGPGNGIECSDCSESTELSRNEDENAGFEPGTLASDRRLFRQGISVARFANGDTYTQNSRGRCEDAPCCGCCS